jgi:PA14 domain
VLNSGAHTFTLTSDDGSRLFVDGALVIDWWSDHTYTSKSATLTLAPGPHTIVVEYYQYYGGARIALTWT